MFISYAITHVLDIATELRSASPYESKSGQQKHEKYFHKTMSFAVETTQNTATLRQIIKKHRVPKLPGGPKVPNFTLAIEHVIMLHVGALDASFD